MVHVIQNPAGTYSLVGQVPRTLCDEREPTTADVLGGRVDPTTRKVYQPRVYVSAREALAAVATTDAGCTIETCACVKARRVEGEGR